MVDWKFWAILANFGQVVGANLAAPLKFGQIWSPWLNWRKILTWAGSQFDRDLKHNLSIQSSFRVKCMCGSGDRQQESEQILRNIQRIFTEYPQNIALTVRCTTMSRQLNTNTNTDYKTHSGGVPCRLNSSKWICTLSLGRALKYA